MGRLGAWAVAAVLFAGCQCPARLTAHPDAGGPSGFRLCVHPGEPGQCTPADELAFGLVGDVAPAERGVRIENVGTSPMRLEGATLSPQPEGFEVLTEALAPLPTPRALGVGTALVVMVRVPPRAVAGPLPPSALRLRFGNAEPQEATVPVRGAWSGCPDGFAACAPGGACETDIHDDVRNCGGCGVVCNLANAQAACVKGRCVMVGACADGFGDCDGRVATGCETPLDTVENCGGCASVDPAFACARPYSTAECTDRVCRQLCEGGRGDCNGNLSEPTADGCETDLTASLDHCGACGAACAPANAAGTCVEGLCLIESCVDGWASCDGEAHTGCEVSVLDDPAHCGACGVDCERVLPNAKVSCSEGRCQFIDCKPGFVDLDGDISESSEGGSNGCEYACTKTVADGELDLPDDDGVDADCDGVDGSVASAVFVVPGGARGAGRDWLTAPTVEEALAVAAKTQRTQVLMGAGQHQVARTLAVPDGVSLYGGYTDDTFRTRRRGTSALRGPASGVLRWTGLTRPVVVDRLDLLAAEATAPGASSVAVWIEEAKAVTLRRLRVAAGDAGPAPAGRPEDAGTDAGASAARGDSVGLQVFGATVHLEGVSIQTGAGERSLGAVLRGGGSVLGEVEWRPGEAATRCATYDGATCTRP